MHDLPGYIATMAAGYLVGNPVRYTAAEGQEEAFTPVLEAYEAASVESVDAELAMDAAVYGKAAEVCYADAEARPRVAQLDARSAFVVYDDTVEHAPLLGITRRDTFDARLERTGEEVTLYTDRLIVHMKRTGRETPRETMREAHYFGGVPVVEYWNNAREEGDFEPVMGLIDAYDTLQSDRVNDKQQFTDAVFVLKGVGALGIDDTEEVADGGDGLEAVPPAVKAAEDPSVRLRRTRTLFLPGDGADAQFVTKPDAESGNELLRMSLKSDIHKLCLVPDLTDEQFAGNVSGVAMRFKLLGLEQLTKIKERWFREGLRTRLRLFCAFLARKGTAALNAEKVQITFSRSLPVNDLEIAQTLSYRRTSRSVKSSPLFTLTLISAARSSASASSRKTAHSKSMACVGSTNAIRASSRTTRSCVTPVRRDRTAISSSMRARTPAFAIRREAQLCAVLALYPARI